MQHPIRKTSRLRWGRISAPGSTYFVSACTAHREPVFNNPTHARHAVEVLDLIHHDRDAETLAATIMPDHIHLLFTLGSRLQLGQVIAKFKSLARDRGHARWRWQQDGFEHRLRGTETAESFAFYIFMNPYRAGVIERRARWPWWVCPRVERFRFLAGLGADEEIPAEWIEKSKQLRETLGLPRST